MDPYTAAIHRLTAPYAGMPPAATVADSIRIALEMIAFNRQEDVRVTALLTK